VSISAIYVSVRGKIWNRTTVITIDTVVLEQNRHVSSSIILII